MLYRLQSKMPQSIFTGCRHWNVQTWEFCVQEKRGSCFRQNYENYLVDGNSSANTVHILGGCVLGTVCSTIWPKWLNLVWFSVNKYLFQSISRHGIWNLIWTSERKLRFSTLCQDCHQCCRVELGFQKSQISSDEEETVGGRRLDVHGFQGLHSLCQSDNLCLTSFQLLLIRFAHILRHFACVVWKEMHEIQIQL